MKETQRNKVNKCTVCNQSTDYQALTICDDCHNTYSTDELKEIIKGDLHPSHSPHDELASLFSATITAYGESLDGMTTTIEFFETLLKEAPARIEGEVCTPDKHLYLSWKQDVKREWKIMIKYRNEEEEMVEKPLLSTSANIRFLSLQLLRPFINQIINNASKFTMQIQSYLEEIK